MQCSNLIDAHQAGHAMLATGLAGFSQVQAHAWRSIDAVAYGKGGSDETQEAHVFLRSVRHWLEQPSVVAAWGNVQQPAHRPEVVFMPARFMNP